MGSRVSNLHPLPATDLNYLYICSMMQDLVKFLLLSWLLLESQEICGFWHIHVDVKVNKYLALSPQTLLIRRNLTANHSMVKYYSVKPPLQQFLSPSLLQLFKHRNRLLFLGNFLPEESLDNVSCTDPFNEKLQPEVELDSG